MQRDSGKVVAKTAFSAVGKVILVYRAMTARFLAEPPREFFFPERQQGSVRFTFIRQNQAVVELTLAGLGAACAPCAVGGTACQSDKLIAMARLYRVEEGGLCVDLYHMCPASGALIAIALDRPVDEQLWRVAAHPFPVVDTCYEPVTDALSAMSILRAAYPPGFEGVTRRAGSLPLANFEQHYSVASLAAQLGGGDCSASAAALVVTHEPVTREDEYNFLLNKDDKPSVSQKFKGDLLQSPLAVPRPPKRVTLQAAGSHVPPPAMAAGADVALPADSSAAPQPAVAVPSARTLADTAGAAALASMAAQSSSSASPPQSSTTLIDDDNLPLAPPSVCSAATTTQALAEMAAMVQVVEAQPRKGGSPLLAFLIRAPPGGGKTYMFTEQIINCALEHRRRRRGRPCLVLCCAAMRNVNERIDADFRARLLEMAESHKLKCSVSYYDSDFAAQASFWTLHDSDAYDLVVRITSLNTLERSVVRDDGAIALRPDLLLIDESEQAVEYAATSPMLSGQTFHGVMQPVHEQVWRWLVGVAARTRTALMLADRDAGMTSRLFVSDVVCHMERVARSHGRPLSRRVDVRPLELRIRSPRAYKMLPASDHAYASAVLRHHVLERGERVIVAGTSVPNLELHHRMLMAAIESDPRVLDGSLRKPVVVLVHADSDRLMLKQISKDPLRYCREHHVDVLMHSTVLGRGTSIDKLYFHVSMVLAHPHTDWATVVQAANRQRHLVAEGDEEGGGVRYAYLMFRASMTRVEPLLATAFFAPLTLGAAAYACSTRLLQQHAAAGRHRSRSEQMSRRTAAYVAVAHDVEDGRPFLNRQVPLATVALFCMARNATAREVHYPTFLQETRDEEIAVEPLSVADPALHRWVEGHKIDISQFEMQLAYEKLSATTDDNAGKRAALASAGYGRARRGEEEDSEPPPPPPCVPLLADASRSPTLMSVLRAKECQQSRRLVYLYLVQQECGDGADSLDDESLDEFGMEAGCNQRGVAPVAGDGGAMAAALERMARIDNGGVVSRLNEVNECIQLPFDRRAPLELELRIVTGALKLSGVAHAHKHPMHGSRYRRDFSFQAAGVAVPHPFDPEHGEVEGEAFVAALVERLPALARTHRVFAGITVPDLVSSPNLRLARIHNLLKAVINRLLGSSVIGTDHRVQSDRLEYRVALLPLWLAKHGVDVPAAVARYFAALGEPWREVLDGSASTTASRCSRLITRLTLRRRRES